MKRYMYSCDGGCICAGNETFKVHIPNGYGDGEHVVKVVDNREDVPTDDYKFVAFLHGEFGIYDYDCYTKEEFENHCLVRLSGRYSVFVNDGIVILRRD